MTRLSYIFIITNLIVLECSNFAKPGYRFSFSLTRTSRRATDLADCEDLCLRETQFVCRTLAFTGDRGGDNCDLTDRDFRDMSYRDMEEDRDWDIIERTRWLNLLLSSQFPILNNH